ncbi:unnamed protein product [Scytosiphon promiscuus]
MGKRDRDRSLSSSSSSEGRDRRKSSKSSKQKKQEKKKKSSKRASRSESRSRSPPPKSKSGRSKRDDRSRSPSVDEEERRRAKEARREKKYQEKLALKKAQRRAAESEHDKAERKRKAKMDGTAAHFGYTNDINPFGDSNLTEQFVWGKKKEKEGTANQQLSKRDMREMQKKNVNEIEKVRFVPVAKNAPLCLLEYILHGIAEESRLREQQQYGDWQKKEEHFHLKQATQRSKIRLVEGRDRPIDRLAKNVLLFGQQDEGEVDVGIKYGGKGEVDVTGLEMELREPYKLFDGLTLEELEELQTEILQYQDLVGENGPNRDFWLSLGVVCDDKVAKAKELLGETEEGVATGGLHKTVIDDVTAKFENQSVEELAEQKTKIQEMLDSGKASVDSEFWEAVLKELHVFQAMAKLREVHQAMLEAQLEKLEGVPLVGERRSRRISLRVLLEELEPCALDAKLRRPAVATTTAADSSALAMGMLANEKSKGMGDQEEGMDLADEIDMGGKTYWWHDKFRPRKPRYFNRVKTGYDWNKYNQTHYDHDNPPPKTVQGYKFNVFYPDLIDRQETPTYHLEKADHPGFAILRFHAGPPYEDIAFKIINREWEFGRKRGFRCVFERGVLSLYFNFKSLWYRK